MAKLTVTVRPLGIAAAILVCTVGRAVEVKVEIGRTRAPEAWRLATDRAMRGLAKSLAVDSAQSRALGRRTKSFPTQMFLPMRVVLTDNGRPLRPNFPGTRGPDDIVPTFDTSGGRTFPSQYREFLEDTFVAALPAMNAVYGKPARPGAVKIKNYDADIQDRYAVAGGYYVPNAPGGPEIRLPVYNNPVAAAINYIHCLLLAYAGDKPMPFDAYAEGISRGATAVVARIPGSIPDAPTQDQIEAVLEGLYDMSATYDWSNRPGIGTSSFIAPNLLALPLPPGGSTGGAYLLRYQMAGTVWIKALAERPALVAEINKRYYLNPNLYKTGTAFEELVQDSLDTVTGQASATIEGDTINVWSAKNAILDTRTNPGLKVVPQAFPGLPIPGSDDFGVFGIVLNAFRTERDGDETLLAGRCYPLFFRPDFTRFFTSAQDDVLDVAGAYGSVVPNFPGTAFNNQPYRVTVDLPFNGQVARCSFPAGAISTGADPNPKSFAGTMSGLPDPGSATYVVTAEWPGGSQGGITGRNFAFGFDITDASFLNATSVTIRVFRRQGPASTEVLRRVVNKGQGNLYVELVPESSTVLHSFTRPGRLALIGLPVSPYRPNVADVLGLSDGQTLAARWNPLAGRNDLYPIEANFFSGYGFWVRPPSSRNLNVLGLSVPLTPVAVALNPGWNCVTAPFTGTVPTTRILVTSAALPVSTYSEAVAAGDIGSSFFRFQPEAGSQDRGSMLPATSMVAGEAYFVRSNRAEGGVLIFLPPGSQSREGRAAPALPRAYKIRLERPGKGWAEMEIGQHTQANYGWDDRFDLDVPPSPHGISVCSLVGSRRFARDVRPNGDPRAVRIMCHGLEPGQRYVLRFARVSGRERLAVGPNGRRTLFDNGGTLGFVATRPSEGFWAEWRR